MANILKGLSNATLIVLQWVLMFWGVILILLALNTYIVETAYFSTLPQAAFNQDYYFPRTFHRAMTGMVTGLIAIGVGAGLFYLRRIFLRRQN
jgi:hypothetical protein